MATSNMGKKAIYLDDVKTVPFPIEKKGKEEKSQEEAWASMKSGRLRGRATSG